MLTKPTGMFKCPQLGEQRHFPNELSMSGLERCVCVCVCFVQDLFNNSHLTCVFVQKALRHRQMLSHLGCRDVSVNMRDILFV